MKTIISILFVSLALTGCATPEQRAEAEIFLSQYRQNQQERMRLEAQVKKNDPVAMRQLARIYASWNLPAYLEKARVLNEQADLLDRPEPAPDLTAAAAE